MENVNENHLNLPIIRQTFCTNFISFSSVEKTEETEVYSHVVSDYKFVR